MISEIRKIDVTEQSHPFMTAVGKYGFEENGYREEEFFISGTANIYERFGDGKRIRYPDAPYTNRIIVRYPEEGSRFSGNVVVEILNSTSMIDIDRIWVLTGRHMLKNGDIYVGITSKPNVLPAFRRFDSLRYRPLSWNNPLEYDIPEQMLGNLAGHSKKETEDGLFWDMLLDCIRLLRSSDQTNPIYRFLHDNESAGTKRLYYYLSGWSQSGGYMIRYLRDFAGQEGKNLFDGYFSCGSISMCTPNLNQEDVTDILSQDHTLEMLDRPFVDMHTESDNIAWGNADTRKTQNDYYRAYDVTGSSHDTTTSMEDYYRNDPDPEKAGIVPKYPGTEPHPNSLPYEYAYAAGLEMLYRWVRCGEEPVRVDAIAVNDAQRNVIGTDGNSVGGWRLPSITYPVCRFAAYSTPADPLLELSAQLYGHEEPYPVEVLKERYGSLAAYRALIEQETDRCIQSRLLLPEDRTACVEYSVRLAGQYGLD